MVTESWRYPFSAASQGTGKAMTEDKMDCKAIISMRVFNITRMEANQTR
jgi:hypothetical protein